MEKDVEKLVSFSRLLGCHESRLSFGIGFETSILYDFNNTLFISSAFKILSPFKSIARSVDLHCLLTHPEYRFKKKT